MPRIYRSNRLWYAIRLLASRVKKAQTGQISVCWNLHEVVILFTRKRKCSATSGYRQSFPLRNFFTVRSSKSEIGWRLGWRKVTYLLWGIQWSAMRHNRHNLWGQSSGSEKTNRQRSKDLLKPRLNLYFVTFCQRCVFWTWTPILALKIHVKIILHKIRWLESKYDSICECILSLG